MPSDLRRSLSLLVETMPSLAEGHTSGGLTSASSSPPVTEKVVTMHRHPSAAVSVLDAGLSDATAAAAAAACEQTQGEDGEGEDEGFESAGEEDDHSPSQSQ